MTALLADPRLPWYVARATGAVCLVLLTVATTLGLAAAGGAGSARWPRFAVQGLHRSVALLALVLLAVHVGVVVADPYVDIAPLDAVVPFVGAYRPLWLGLGALALDLFVALVVTSLLRGRLPQRAWRAVHLGAYACWPAAVVHGVGTGSDPGTAWYLLLTAACAGAVLATLAWRLAAASRAAAAPVAAARRKAR